MQLVTNGGDGEQLDSRLKEAMVHWTLGCAYFEKFSDESAVLDLSIDEIVAWVETLSSDKLTLVRTVNDETEQAYGLWDTRLHRRLAHVKSRDEE